MSAIEGVVRNGRIEVTVPTDWPEGAKVTIIPLLESADQPIEVRVRPDPEPGDGVSVQPPQGSPTLADPH
jgi:hypothetical protein